MKFEKICVIGLGYIGLPTAATFAAHGCRVLGTDINAGVIETLNRGEIHIHEPGLREAVGRALKSGNFEAAVQPREADAFILAVPTPFREHQAREFQGRVYKLADMQAVISAAESVVPLLRPGNLVVLESTSPPRTTTDLVAPILERSDLKAGADFFLCYSPERVLPGRILEELIQNARVIGGITPESARAGSDLYAAFVQGEIIRTDSTTAEMVKLMENTYRDVNIAIANEFSRLADRFGIDVWEAIALANRHPRVRILDPGPGVGGHCISVDPWFLVEAAPDLTPLIQQARQVNDGQPHFLAGRLVEAFGSLAGRKVAALGLAYKPDVDDLRESPAVETVRILAREGAAVTAWEPYKPDARLEGISMGASLAEAIRDADLLLLLVRHREFSNLVPAEVARQTRARFVLDAVNGIDPEAWEAAGFRVVRLGDGNSTSPAEPIEP